MFIFIWTKVTLFKKNHYFTIIKKNLLSTQKALLSLKHSERIFKNCFSFDQKNNSFSSEKNTIIDSPKTFRNQQRKMLRTIFNLRKPSKTRSSVMIKTFRRKTNQIRTNKIIKNQNTSDQITEKQSLK